MQTHQGHSAQHDAAAAVAEATEGFPSDLDILFVFSSTAQDPDGVAAALAARFPGVPLAGCTTAGEHISGAHSTGGLVVTGVQAPEYRWATTDVVLDGLDPAAAEAAAGRLFAEVGVDPEGMDAETLVCLLFIDGLSGAEERASAVLADALQGVALAGGSAGDDLQFAQTRVYSAAGAQSGTATLVMVHAHDGAPLQVRKHQHFTTTDASVAVTRVEGRRVYELDGYPALEGYARALGVAPEAVSAELTFQKPVTFACNGELYVRSIQAIHDDGSISFYCAVEEGMVLDIGDRADMSAALAEGLKWSQRPALVVGFNCILRALEATGSALHPEQSAILQQSCDALIGFDTYGEQLNGLHINQTLVAVGFGCAA